MSDIGFKLNGSNAGFRAMIENSQNALTKFNGVLNTFGVGISVAGAVAFFKNVAEKVGAIQDLSDRLGVSTDALQSFAFMAQQAGAKTEQATLMWEKAKKAFDELAAGTPAVVKQFEAIGITQKMMNGLNTEQKLHVMAQAFKQNEKEAGVYSTVVELLGSKALPKLNTVLLRLGEEGWTGFNEGARKAGQLIGEDVIGRIDELGDRLDAQQGRLIKAAAVTMDWWISLNHIPEALAAIAKHAVPDVLVKFGTILGTIPKFLGAAAEAAVGIDIPFVGLEKQAKKAADAIVTILPPMVGLTAEGKKQVLQKYEEIRAQDESLSRTERLKLLKKDLIDAEASLAAGGLSQKQTDSYLLIAAEAKKLIKVEEKGLNADAKKHAETMEDFTKKEIEDKRELLTTAQQMKALRDDEAGWLAILTEKGIAAEVRQHAEIGLAKTRAEMRGVEKKQLEEIADIEAGREVADKSRTKSQVEQLSLKELQNEQLLIAQEQSRIETVAVNGLTTADTERLNVLNQQNQVIEDQIESLKVISTITRKGNSYDQQSDTSLEGVEDRLRSQIDAIKREDFSRRGGVGGKGTPAELYLLQTELFNLEKETKERQQVRDYASRFGETKARREFGDTLTDKALRDWTDQQTATTTAVQDIQQRLALLFPKK